MSSLCIKWWRWVGGIPLSRVPARLQVQLKQAWGSSVQCYRWNAYSGAVVLNVTESERWKHTLSLPAIIWKVQSTEMYRVSIDWAPQLNVKQLDTFINVDTCSLLFVKSSHFPFTHREKKSKHGAVWWIWKKIYWMKKAKAGPFLESKHHWPL